jgi:hypothetical protein
LLSLVHVLEWRAAVNPEAIALTDHQGGKVLRATLRELFWAGRDRLVS